MEIQKEEVRMEEAPIRKDYSRDDERPKPFMLDSLSASPATGKQGFYTMASMSVKTKKGNTQSIGFPPFLYGSCNHYDIKHSTHFRRLKNCIVMMEWIPDPKSLRAATEERPLSAETEEQLEKTFKMFDHDGSGFLDEKELGQVLRSLDVELEDEDDDKELAKSLDLNQDGRVDLEELKIAVKRQSFFGIQEGRFFVVLSLAEAEVITSWTSMHSAHLL